MEGRWPIGTCARILSGFTAMPNTSPRLPALGNVTTLSLWSLDRHVAGSTAAATETI